MNRSLLPLGELKEGEKGIIRRLSQGDLSLKLLEMGFLPGESVTIEKIAPLGDPISVKVGSYLLSLRKEEANVVMVQQQ
ncbi:MAG: ferrous iron transport protein A [Chitinophagales bacterium]|nr:ferrous iron transport protein A [Bacteroidota bacterium]MBX7142630.1 ferrous iron transport protein A [Chitinophagales bacterium]